MIALGGAIGTGLVIGSGTALARSGPGSLFIAYCMVGLVYVSRGLINPQPVLTIRCYALMVALGEMSTQFPTKKGFAGHATRFVDEAFGFTVALSYLCKYLVVSAFQIVAGALIIQYWNRSINPAVWCTISIGVVLAINILGVRYFGEVEFWLSFLKIITLTGMILLGFIISLGGVPGQDRIGFAYWQNGKAFKEYKAKGDVGKFLGFVNALVNALFAFMGTELVGVTVGEAKVSA
jgi:amino acid transporter